MTSEIGRLSDEKRRAIEPYRAPPGEPKKYTYRPCALCGWNRHMAIHKNPNLDRPDTQYHAYVEVDHDNRD